MQLKTMAMKITENNWSVAVAVLGPDFASTPLPEVLGNFVVINTFHSRRRRLDPYAFDFNRVRRGENELTLRNIELSAEDFEHEYKYDQRKKDLETFFPVTHVNHPKPVERAPSRREARIDEAVRTLNAAVADESDGE